MTTGERLQLFRKQRNLSQEEFAQKLLVTQQMVNLWETDQTIPTVENLLRMKEVFGVTVDAILTGDEETASDEQSQEQEVQAEQSEQEAQKAQNETYTFTYSKQELYGIKKVITGEQNVKGICFVILFLGVIVYSIIAGEKVLTGIFVGVLVLYVALLFKTVLATKKKWQESVAVVPRKVYLYEVYQNYLKLTIKQDDAQVFSCIIKAPEIKSYWSTKEYYLFEYANGLYVIKKEFLSDNSLVHSFFLSLPVNAKRPAKSRVNKWKEVGDILMVFSIFSIIVAATCIGKMTSGNNMFASNLWVCYLFLPVPISSIVVGVLLNKWGLKRKRYIVIGVIMSLLLIIYGSMGFINYNAVNDNGFDYVLSVERRAKIDLPESENASTIKFTTDGSPSKGSDQLYYMSTISYTQEEVEEFEENIKSDEKWLEDMPSELVDCLPETYNSLSSDYYLLYNLDLGEYNTFPGEAGQYRCVYILYNDSDNQMQIVEYEADIVA